MSKTGLEYATEYVNGMMDGLALPYALKRWKDNVIPDLYFTGEITEVPSASKDENGKQLFTAILRGFTREGETLLYEANAKIENSCPRRGILPGGASIVVEHDTAIPVHTGDAELTSIKINLNIQVWRVKS